LAFTVVFSMAQAGPQIGLYARSAGGWCAPAHSVCPPLRAYPKVITCAWPTYDYPVAYGYALSPIVVSTSFSNVSPVFDDGRTGIYRVPAPVISAPPITIPPDSTFGWRR
jgi:hypothetical protein